MSLRESRRGSDFTIQLRNTTYLLYSASGKQESFVLAHPLIYIMAMSGPVVTANVMHCLLVEVLDDQVVRAEFESSGGFYSLPKECLALFSKDEAFMAVVPQWVRARAKAGDTTSASEIARLFQDEELIRFLAEYGDTPAALELARVFGEREPLRRLAGRGETQAAVELAREFGDSGPLRALAERGDSEAAIEVARRYDDQSFLRIAAERGDVVAAIAMAREFDDPRPLKTLVEQQDHTPLTEIEVEGAYQYYQIAILEEGLSPDAIQSLCQAANAGHAKAMEKLAHLHRPWGDNEHVLQENDRVAYMWYTLAGVFDSRRTVAEEMTSEEIAEAKQMARDWKPGQCPSP